MQKGCDNFVHCKVKQIKWIRMYVYFIMMKGKCFLESVTGGSGLRQRQRGMKGPEISLPSEQHLVFILYMRKLMKQYYPFGCTKNL